MARNLLEREPEALFLQSSSECDGSLGSLCGPQLLDLRALGGASLSLGRCPLTRRSPNN